MKIPFTLGSKTFLLEPYRTAQEKDIMLSSSFGISDFERIFEIIGFETEEELSDEEKKVILYKYREISLGDEVDIKFKCDKCGQGNDAILEVNNFAKPGIQDNKDIKKINKPVTDDNLVDFLITPIDIDDLDIEDFELLKKRILDNQLIFNFVKTARCLKCNTQKKFDLSSAEYIVEIMSDDTLMSLYKSYNFLIYFGKYSKEGIDSMYPFERSIFIGLLNKTKEDLNK